MSRERLAALFDSGRDQGVTRFLPFMTVGLPDLEHSPQLFRELPGDAFEVGIPYSDPLMDGPTIQRAGQQALRSGANFRASLGVIEQVAEHRPVLVMSYTNVAMRIGIDAFAREVAAAGASAVILSDLPLDEADQFLPVLDSQGIGLVMFVAPTTPTDRIEAVADRKPVFIYAIADLGVTGAREELSARAVPLAARIREVTDTPIVFGVGISTPHQAAAVAPHADGVIVGSAIVKRVLDAPDPLAAIADGAATAQEFADAITG